MGEIRQERVTLTKRVTTTIGANQHNRSMNQAFPGLPLQHFQRLPVRILQDGIKSGQ